MSFFVENKYKLFRLDLGWWESEMILLWAIRFYKYEVFVHGETLTHVSLRIRKRKQAKYFHFKELPKIKIGKKEFDEQYNGNRWLIPLNFELDLSLP